MEILEETFASRQKDEELYILQIEHHWKLMPHLVMPNFQPVTMAFATGSTSTTRTSEAQEVGEEIEIDSCRVDTNVSTKTQEKPISQPQLKLQPNSSIKGKAPKVQKVSMEKVKDSPPRSQLKGTRNKVIKPIIKLPCDQVG